MSDKDMTPQLTLRLVQAEMSLLPEDDVNYPQFVITIERRGTDEQDSWAVKHGVKCLSTEGTWDHEPMPSNREDEWLAVHRFTWDEATRRAMKALENLKVMGKTALEVLAEQEEQA